MTTYHHRAHVSQYQKVTAVNHPYTSVCLMPLGHQRPHCPSWYAWRGIADKKTLAAQTPHNIFSSPEGEGSCSTLVNFEILSTHSAKLLI
jgi:hypothetical protein